MKTVQKFLISASAIISTSLLAVAPAFAASLTNIQFNTNDFRTYFTDSWSDGNGTDAVSALTDGSAITNVELGFSTENQVANVGFTATLGVHSVAVETVTAADWQNGLATQWIADFQAAYPALFAATLPGVGSLGQAIAAEVMAGPSRAGDPNIGSFNQNDETGLITLQMIGHYDVLNAPWLQTGPYATMVPMIRNLLLGEPLQISEVAKVTIDGQVHYAYSFQAAQTGWLAPDAAANDTSSGTGIYSWYIQGSLEPTPKTESVPEPSLMLGLVAVGGLVAATRRKH